MEKQFGIWIKQLALIFLTGCSNNVVLLNPKGDVGSNEKSLILISAALMMIVVLPAIIMTIVFAWRYRESNTNAKYTPEWKSSKKIEILTWIVPSLIITVLSVLVWVHSHKLDPYHPLTSNREPINIQVVSLDWKWLFIYPDEQIAVVNQIVFPTNVPVHFYLTSDTVMNSFFIPQLGSQIMTMAGMQTQLHLIATTPGTYQGISSNFSGLGFTGMSFKAIANSEKEFKDWVNNIKKKSKNLDNQSYMELRKSSIHHPIEYFSSIQPNIFVDIVNAHGGVLEASILKEHH